MDKYIYFAAEMPTLKLGSEQFPSIEDFLEEAGKWMTPADYSLLTDIVLDRYEAKKSHGIYSGFLEFEYILRQELSNYRRAAKEGYEYKFIHIPPQLVKDGTPLDVEIQLMQYRWNWLDDQEFGHYSDVDFFVLYYLKLQILYRIAVFKEEAGQEAFQALVTQNTEKTEELLS